jgi:hypothetical protein
MLTNRPPNTHTFPQRQTRLTARSSIGQSILRRIGERPHDIANMGRMSVSPRAKVRCLSAGIRNAAALMWYKLARSSKIGARIPRRNHKPLISQMVP